MLPLLAINLGDGVNEFAENGSSRQKKKNVGRSLSTADTNKLGSLAVAGVESAILSFL